MAAPEKKISRRPPEWTRGGPSPSPDDALRAAELRKKEAEAGQAELKVQKLAGEVARQPLETRLIEVQTEEGLAEVSRRQSEARSLDAARFRSDALLVVILLLIILVLALALVNPDLLKAIGGALPWVRIN